FAAAPLSRTRLRTPALLVLAVLGTIGATYLGGACSDSLWFASLVGASDALLWGNLISTVLGTACFAMGLRALSLRRRLFSLFEVLCVGVVFAQLVAAHRFGAINRPFELADSIIAQGGDPTVALLLIGALAAALIIALLFRERSVWRSLLHLWLALLLLALVLSSTHLLGLPSPPAAATGLGLRPDEKDKPEDKQQKGQRRPRDGHSDNEHLDFRDNYDSQGRQVPLAVVLLHDDYSPPTGLYYFRQTAFSQYNGKRLVSATTSGVDEDVAPSFVSQKTTLAVVPNARGDRTELDTTVALLAEHTRPFALESAESIEPLANPDSGRFRRVYRVTSSALSAKLEELLGRNVGNPAWSPAVREHYTSAPKDPRYTELAQEIASGIHESLRDDPVARALAVTVWLSRQGTYSLKSGHANAEDPTADFLFGDRVGYCVHFAHAAVYLMRSLGVPARVGAGYVVDEAARQGGSSILVTGANSHAWPEFYVDGVGWVIADVSPAQSLDPPPPPPDPDLQRLLGEMARGLKPMPQSEDRPLEPVIAAARMLRVWLVRGALWLSALMLCFMYAVKLWRRASPAFANGGLPRVAYRAELDRLSDVSLRRHFGETREAFAVRIAALSPSFPRLTERHLAAKFAREAAVDASEVRQLRTAVAREVRQGVSWWKRWLGALTPWSWILSR
ncbi:MAG TPA: transglutaminase-like domain-containing protein, partial [Polyangiales bacterium]|nr:transglutaminase-like domain-containing protein [Polyangiales bacterium]